MNAELAEKSRTRKERRAEVARKRVRETLSKLPAAELLDRTMQLYEERNAYSEAARIAYIRQGISSVYLEKSR